MTICPDNVGDRKESKDDDKFHHTCDDHDKSFACTRLNGKCERQQENSTSWTFPSSIAAELKGQIYKDENQNQDLHYANPATCPFKIFRFSQVRAVAR